MSPRASTASSKPTKTSTKATAAPAPTPRKRPAARRSGRLSDEERQRFIAEAAYYKAEKRSFAAGGELDDWVEAEAEIDALLNGRGTS